MHSRSVSFLASAPALALGLALGFGGLLSGCATPSSAALPAPPRIEQIHRRGGPLDVPQGAPEELGAPRFLLVELKRFPHRVGRHLPLAQEASRATVATSGERALRPASLALSDARMTPPGELFATPEGEEFFASTLAWLEDETRLLRLGHEPGVHPAGEEISITITARSDGWEIALGSALHSVEPSEVLKRNVDITQPSTLRGDVLFLNKRPLPPRYPAWLLFPSPWSEAWYGLALREIEVDERAAARFLQQRNELLRERLDDTSVERTGMALLDRALANEPTRQAAMNELGHTLGLPVIAELSLAVAREPRNAMAQSLRESLAKSGELKKIDILVAAFDGLASSDLSTRELHVLDGLLSEHFGALVRRRDHFEQAVAAAGPDPDIEAIVRAENLLLLDDSSSSLRWRAWLYLQRHGGVPQGYHPLAPRKERRDALAAAKEAEA